MIKLYGIPASRALRPLWMLEELGLEYENVPTNFTVDNRKPEYLALNPNGRIPTLVDGDIVLFESMAINLYLARKYDGGLEPKSLEDQARAVQWSFWVVTELEKLLVTVILNRFVFPEAERDPAAIDSALAEIPKPLAVLDGVLEGRRYLVGESFSVADLNVASVLVWAAPSGVSFAKYPNLERWLQECLSRPAARKAQGLSGS
jgi:glutathione S-transferase